MALPFVPTSPEQLEHAVQEGILVEGPNFDAKAQLDPGPKGNKALAIDLAAFSILGGLIAIGIAEQEDAALGRRLVPKPIPLHGLKERVSQVAASRVDPPVAVTVRELPVSGERGYLLIIVPASPAAPHQVDGQYRGRSDSTNRVLTDAEVRLLLAERRRVARNIEDELEDLVRRDPSPASKRENAHLFVVARPQLPTSPSMLHDAIGRDWRR